MAGPTNQPRSKDGRFGFKDPAKTAQRNALIDRHGPQTTKQWKKLYVDADNAKNIPANDNPKENTIPGAAVKGMQKKNVVNRAKNATLLDTTDHSVNQGVTAEANDVTGRPTRSGVKRFSTYNTDELFRAALHGTADEYLPKTSEEESSSPDTTANAPVDTTKMNNGNLPEKSRIGKKKSAFTKAFLKRHRKVIKQRPAHQRNLYLDAIPFTEDGDQSHDDTACGVIPSGSTIADTPGFDKSLDCHAWLARPLTDINGEVVGPYPWTE